MARGIDTLVTQSLLDRLSTDDEGPSTRSNSMRLYRESLKRDLEWLLNTRQALIPGLERFAHANRSVIHYGLMDTSSISLASSMDRQRLQQAVTSCITHFEPRLTDVRIVIGSDGQDRKQMRFHVEAQMLLDPAPEPISFDTVLDLTSGEYTVS